MLVLLSGKAIAQGHDHTLTVGITIGPLVLRLALLAAVPVVTGYAFLQSVLPTSNRTANALVAGTAAVAVLLTLMLAGGSDIPGQAVVLVLAALAGPLFLILSRDERSRTAVRRIRVFAPVVLVVAAVCAFVEFGRAWLGRWPVDTLGVILYTAVALAFVGLAWFTVCQPCRRFARIAVQVVAALLATAVIGGTAQATVLRLGDSRSAAESPSP